MKTYNVGFKDKARYDLAKLKKNEPKAYQKALKLIAELYEHPYIGTGKPEPLLGNKHGEWSRRITQKHRLIYEVHDNEVIVVIISAYGHYDDK